MSRVLVYVAADGGRIKRSSLEVLSEVRRQAAGAGLSVDALLVGSAPEDFAGQVAEYGPNRILSVAHSALAEHRNPTLLAALAAAVAFSDPRFVVMASTEGVKDVLGALAIRVEGAAIPDVSTFDLGPAGVEATRPVMAANQMARTHSESSLVLVSVRSGSYEASVQPSEPEQVAVPLSFDDAGVAPVLREVLRSGGDAVDLSEARVVVAAGRGVKDEDGKALVMELAEVLGAAIGASRAVVENGLFPATAQIGQTGKVVSPEIYFAVGISGAIQHVAGMANSKVIVAVNRDADAPIFGYATYGIVGDLYKVLPALIGEIKTAKAAG